jgi:hypothetical protein
MNEVPDSERFCRTYADSCAELWGIKHPHIYLVTGLTFSSKTSEPLKLIMTYSLPCNLNTS